MPTRTSFDHFLAPVADLVNRRVELIVAGSLACRIQGCADQFKGESNHPPKDADLACRDTWLNWWRLKAAAAQIGLKSIGQCEKEIQFLSDDDARLQCTFEFQPYPNPPFAELLSRASILEFDGVSIPILSVVDLAYCYRRKQVSGRALLRDIDAGQVSNAVDRFLAEEPTV